MKNSRIYFAEKQGRSQEEISWCSRAAERWWKVEKAHIMRVADEVMRHEFIFDLPWDMEQTCEPVIFGDEIDWEYMPGNDAEFIFQMNRNRYWICLGQAYAMTGNEDYAREYVNQLISWIGKNPLTDSTRKTTWRTIEAGIRGEYWIKAMGYFIYSPFVTDEVWEQFETALICHADYLLACDIPFSVKSNWGVLENHGLYMIGMAFPESLKSAAYIDTSLTRLARQARIQIMDDGVQWEQSPMYHNEVLKCYLEVLRTADKYEAVLPELFYEKVKQMAYANLYWMKPSGCQPAGGDSDETDIRDVLTECALLLEDKTLRSVGYTHLDFEGVWDYGSAGQETYNELYVRKIKDTFYELPHSGNWFLRSDWGQDADYIHFRCGSMGGGHGHFDKLHIDLSICGEDILMDPGRYTYVPSEDRYELKSSRIHNTPSLDGREYTECVDAWAVKGLTLPIAQGGMQKGIFTYMHGGHLGYMKDGIFVNRRILAAGTKVYVIMDEFFGAGEHTYAQNYHFNPEGAVGQGRDKIYYRGKNAKATFHMLNSISESTKIKMCEKRLSRHYNQLERSMTAEVSCQGEAMASMITVITTGAVNDTREWTVTRVPVVSAVREKNLEYCEAEAVKIENGEQSYLVLFSHVESGADCEYIGACGVYAIGQVMACDLTEEDPEMVILHW